MKLCNKCSTLKDKVLFSKCKSKKDGLQSKCKACAKTVLQKYKKANRDRCNFIAREWAKNNKEKVKKSCQRYKETHPEQYKAYTNYMAVKRKTLKKQASPIWLTKEQQKEIRSIYNLAKELQWLSDDKLHVDHIVPLKGKNVCGLHVPWNLQILSRHDNLQKKNKF